MQDNKLLGKELSPKSSVNAKTDMAEESFLPKGFQFEAPPAPQRDYDVTLGDTLKAVGSGTLRGVAGLGELSENMFGVGESLRDVATSGADSLQESMTQDGRDAVNSRLFQENENGNPEFAEGAGDIDVWAMKVADGIGSLAATFAGGGVAGAGAKLALRGTITKAMLKKGMSEQAAQAVATKAIQRIATTGATTSGMGISLGGASLDARDAVMQMDASWLADNSDIFQSTLLRLSDDPENQGKSATELFDLAKEETANYASLQMSTDPTAVAASVAGAMGDKYLFGAILGKMGKGVVPGAVKGAITEGGTEFIEGYGQTYARNTVTNDITNQNVDPTSGALVDGLEGAAVGKVIGGTLGAAGGLLSQNDKAAKDEPVNTEPTNVNDAQEQDIAQEAEETPVQTEQKDQTRRPLFTGNDVNGYLSDANKLKAELTKLNSNGQTKPLVGELSQGLDRHIRVLRDNPELSPEDAAAAQRSLQNIFAQYQQIFSPDVTYDSIYKSQTPEAAQQQGAEVNNETTLSQLRDEAKERQESSQRGADLQGRLSASRQALQQRGVLPERTERNESQQIIELARSFNPERAGEIEQFLQSEDADKNPQLAAQLEQEYQALAEQAGELDVDPLLTSIDRRQTKNKADMDSREKPHQRVDRKQNEYALDDTVTRRKASIREELLPNLLPEDRSNENKVNYMVDLEYALRYPSEEQTQEEQEQDGLERFNDAPFDRKKAQSAIETKAIESKNAHLGALAQQERNSRPSTPEENPNWFGAHPETGERTTRAFMRDFANLKGREETNLALNDIEDRKEKLGEPISAFSDRPNSMKMREQGKKPIRDFAGIDSKTSRMSKRLRKRINKAKGFDNQAVLSEFQQHEKRLAAYEEAALRRAEYEASLPENIERRNSAESLFKEYISDQESREFAENEITQTIKRINTLVDSSSQGSALELDGQASSVAQVKKQMAHSVRNLANKFVGKTAAMMNAAKQNRDTRDAQVENESSQSLKRRTDENEAQNGSMRDGFVSDGVKEVVPGVEHLGKAIDGDSIWELLSDEYEMVVTKGDGVFGERYIADALQNPNDYVTTQNPRGPYTLWKKLKVEQDAPTATSDTSESIETKRAESPDLVEQAKQVIAAVIEKNGGKLKGVRTAYRDKGFTASELQKALGDKSISEFEREVKQELSNQTQKDKPKTTKDEADSTPKAESLEQGKVGMKLSPGQVVLTVSGRETTPFPSQTKNGVTPQYLAKIDKWLIDNAIAEAESRGDDFNGRQFKAMNLKNLSPADKDHAELYLFQFSPSVSNPKTIKPLSSAVEFRKHDRVETPEGEILETLNQITHGANDDAVATVMVNPDTLGSRKRRVKVGELRKLREANSKVAQSDLQLNQDTTGDLNDGGTRASDARSDERSTRQSEVQNNVGRETGENSETASEASGQASTTDGPVRNELSDSRERGVSRGTDERLTLDDIDGLQNGTPSQRIAANLAAIRLMKELISSNQPATLEQKKTLAHYSGWGGLGSVFDPTNTSKSQQAAHQELKSLLTDEEYNNLRESIRNAFYTSESVVKSMWEGVKAFGLGDKPMNVLEPSIGSGNFVGWQPTSMRDKSTWFSTELDSVTGNIAKLIYPDANVQIKGFEQAPFKHGVFSLAIGNPPFGSTPIRDSKNPDISGMNIHNYFLAKSAKLLHENGLMMMVVTNRFLDTLNKNHAQLSKELDFVGAVRLPNTAFKTNASTEVVTDIVVFRKLKADEKASNTLWTDVDGELNGFRVNKWFEQNPQYVLGEVAQGTMYRGDESESTVNPTPEHADLGKSLAKALKSLAKGQDLSVTNEGKDAIASQVMLSESDLATDGMMLNQDGKVMRRGMDHPVNGAQLYEVTPKTIWTDEGWTFDHIRQMIVDGNKEKLKLLVEGELLHKGKIKSQFTSSKAKEAASKAVVAYLNSNGSKAAAINALEAAIDASRLGPNPYRKLKSLLAIRNTTLALIQAEKTGASDIEALRKRLNVQYDEFANAFATKGKNRKLASISAHSSVLDGDIGVETGLDSVNSKGEVTKSAIFTKRMLFPYKKPSSASNVGDAVNYSMREHGRVNPEYIGQLLGVDKGDALQQLTEGDKPYLLMNPETEKYEFIDDYLSGDVKAKYQAAKRAGLETNAKLLEAVLPEDKAPEQIKPSIRATWMDASVFERFADALGYKAKVTVNRSLGAISVMTSDGSPSALGAQFKHDRATLADLFNSAANGKSLVIYDGAGKERTKNEKATKEVNALANKLASTFVTWAQNDSEASKQIADNFNERINTHVNRKYNGRLYLQTVGMNPTIDMRKTQLDGALRMIQSKNTLLDHTVGSGKTFTAITGMMERKRLGLSKKPMAVVPNHILGSFHKDILKLYPGANVLVADDKAFSAKKRKQFFSRIATGDYDVILMGHSHLRAMPNDIESFRAVINEKISELRSALEEARADAKASGQRGASISQIEESIKRLKNKITEKEKALSENSDQIGVNFSDLGVDYLVIDEAHEFKNLTYATRADRVVGMNDPKGSEKALDLLIKTRSIQGLENGGVTFMTGTPISNSLVEVYTMMYYLGHDTLLEKNMSFYDAFAGSFFNTEITLEYTPTGTVKERSVLKGLNNMQQLSTLYRSFADVITQKDMVNIYRQDVEAKNKATGENKTTRFPIPNIKGGKRQLDIAPATQSQREYNDYLVARMEAFNHLGSKAERQEYAKLDNPLWVLTDAKKASLDVRLVDPSAERDPTGKIARAADRIKSIYDQWHDEKGAQLVFSDMGTPAKYAIANVKAELKGLAEAVMGKSKAKAFVDSRIKAHEGEMPYSTTLQELTERVNALAETGEIDSDKFESLEETIRELNASTLTADTGFSVYDDLKAALIEKGVPEGEIAFIHDHNTTKKKEALFDLVRDGDVRVLIGSSMKMGAGTNVQDKLVALHHMDAPWRPSDMEQREGRIVRQGNEFYERAAEDGKPDDFEVELVAYTTQGSSDPVMWQILERKAGAIEQFRNGELDEFIEDSNSDADSYAQFKAASTGNPIYRLKLESDATLLDLESSYTAQASSLGASKRFIENYEDKKADLELGLAKIQKADITEFDAEEFTQLATEAQAEYLAAMNAYDADIELYSELDAKERKARGLKKPQKPKRPAIHLLDSDYSSDLNRTLIKPALDAIAKDKEWQGRLKLGKHLALELQVDYIDYINSEEKGRETVVSVALVDEKGRIIRTLSDAVSSSTITGSQRLMSTMHLNAIATELNQIERQYKEQLSALEVGLKEAKKLSNLDISKLRGELDQARDRNLWLSVEAEMADLKEDIRRSETPNKFIDSEQRRKVSRSTFDPSKIQAQELEHNGSKYDTLGVRMKYPGWQFDSVVPALNESGEYVHLLMSNAGSRDKPVVSQVVPQPKNTPKPEYEFISEAKARHESRLEDEAKREIEAPVDDDQSRSSSVMFSRVPVTSGVEGDAVSEPRVNRTLIELWAANVIRDNPVIGAAGDLIRVVSRESDLPAHIKQEIETDKSHGTVEAVFDGDKVYIVADKHSNQDSVEQALLHELAGHYGLRKLFGKNIQAELTDIRARLGGKRGVLKLAKKFNVNLAHYATDFADRVANGELTQDKADDLLFDELLAHVSQMPRMAKPLERMWQKIRRFLKKLGFTKTAGYTNADLLDLIQRIRSNLINNPDPDGPDSGPKPGNKWENDSESMDIMFSRSANGPTMSIDEALAQKQNKLVRKIKKALYAAPVVGQTLDAIGRNKYALLTLRQLGEVSIIADKPLKKKIDAYLDEINAMEVTQNMLAEEAATIAEELSDWSRANKKEADELFSFAHEATLADVDPSEVFQSRTEELKESIAKQERIMKEEGGLNSDRGVNAWNTLKEERELLKQEPNRRKRHVELRPKFARLNQEQKKRYRQMRDHYRAQSERMNEALEENINRAVQDEEIRKAMLAELRQRNERAAKGLYFPLSRHGDYWIDFQDQNGERQFMMFETKGEMELAAENLKNAGYQYNSGMKAQANAVQKASLPFVADVLQLVEKANMHTPAKESLSDEIYQMYLRTLPARSMRRNFIHRKGVAGFSKDAVRALADQGFRQSRQQARLDHMDILDNHLDGIQKWVHELPNNVEADRIVEELNKRHDWVRNPARSGWAQKLTSLGFVWMLGFTPAAALVNLSQNLQVALPILGSRYGFAEASKQMMAASGEFLKAATKKNKPRGQGILGGVLTGSEKEAMRRAIAQGVIDVTQASDLAGLAENPNAKYSGAWNKAMNIIGWAFHNAEVFNREVTFIAAYRLGMKKHGNHDQAVEQAIQDTWDSHFDYSSINRARFMQPDVMSVAFQFKQYSQNMTYYLTANLTKALKGESPEVRSMARKQLMGTFFTTAFVGGAGALPLWWITSAMDVAHEIFGDDDEPFDAETEMKAMLAGAVGKEWAAKIWHGASPSIGGRISLNDLWVRNINRDIDANDAYMEYMKQALGPVIGGIGFSWAQGMADISNDHFARGIERIPPKAVKDVLKTLRYINEEGITTRTGSEIVGDLSVGELAGQAIGFSVGRANIQYDENNAIKNYEIHIKKRRQRLMNAYYTAIRLKDGEAMATVMKKIKRFNQSEYGRLNPISNKNLKQSIKARQRNLAKTNNGLQVSPKLQRLVAEYDFF